VFVPHELSGSDSILSANACLHHIEKEALIHGVLLVGVNDYVNVVRVMVEEEFADQC